MKAHIHRDLKIPILKPGLKITHFTEMLVNFQITRSVSENLDGFSFPKPLSTL